MYAVYAYAAGASQANVLADITAILTGTTDVNTLSAACSKASSSIISTVPSGWTLADAAAGTNAKAFTAPLADDATKFKTMVIDLNIANNIYIKGYESWNATTHVGTNLCYTSDNLVTNNLTGAVYTGVSISLVSGGYIYISASARHCLLNASSSSLVFNGLQGVVEHTRNDPWNTVANGYPSFAFISLALSHSANPISSTTQPNISIPLAYAPRQLNSSTGSDITSTNCLMGFYTPISTTAAWGAGSNVSAGTPVAYNPGITMFPTGLVAGADKKIQHSLIPLGLSRNYGFTTILGGDISAFAGLYATTANFGSDLDEVVVGTDTYVIFSSGTGFSMYRTGNEGMPYSPVSPRFALKKA